MQTGKWAAPPVRPEGERGRTAPYSCIPRTLCPTSQLPRSPSTRRAFPCAAPWPCYRALLRQVPVPFTQSSSSYINRCPQDEREHRGLTARGLEAVSACQANPGCGKAQTPPPLHPPTGPLKDQDLQDDLRPPSFGLAGDRTRQLQNTYLQTEHHTQQPSPAGCPLSPLPPPSPPLSDTRHSGSGRHFDSLAVGHFREPAKSLSRRSTHTHAHAHTQRTHAYARSACQPVDGTGARHALKTRVWLTDLNRLPAAGSHLVVSQGAWLGAVLCRLQRHRSRADLLGLAGQEIPFVAALVSGRQHMSVQAPRGLQRLSPTHTGETLSIAPAPSSSLDY